MEPEISSHEHYIQEWERSLKHPDAFWAEVAHTFHWSKVWDTVRTGGFENVDYQWYVGGKTNLSHNCLDRHLDTHRDKAAILYEGNDPQAPNLLITYGELHAAVCRFANALKSLGVEKGDRVCLYMPNTPEAAIAMLACARIGAIHSVVFGGFSAQALADRINDSECKVLVTADGASRGDKQICLKDLADDALRHTPSIRRVVVARRLGNPVAWNESRDVWYEDLMAAASPDCPAVAQDAEDPLFILYTSGSTGRPKGIVHTTGGYMVYVGYTFRNVFRPRPADVFWCTADVGWITGHSYLVYGPLLNGGTTVMFEGVPNFPDAGRFWDVVDKLKVNIFYTAPTAIRALQATGLHWVQGKNLQSLRLLGSVGEPINHEAWEWYRQQVGRGRCPILDTWWQTETGGVMISGLGGLTPQRPTYATLPMPGICPVLLDENGNELPTGPGNLQEGNLCIKYPWPALARTTWGDHARFRDTYFTAYPGYYFTGDGARRDPDGLWRISGRVDDVINVSGHRIGTAELEDVINQHGCVVESAVVAYPHPIKGSGIYAFAIAEGHPHHPAELETEVKKLVAERIGAFARPDHVLFVQSLPKTRSGKIVRRILRKIAEGDTDNLGDTTTLLDPGVVAHIRAGFRNKELGR